MKRIFILSSHPLFGKCIETLLGSQEQLQIVGHVKELPLAIEQIRVLQPDVVIVDSKDSDADRIAVMLRMIEQQLKGRVVALNLRDNKVLIWQGEQRVITELGDFLETITSADSGA